jgi:two-component system NtrC family sensor kinase
MKDANPNVTKELNEHTKYYRYLTINMVLIIVLVSIMPLILASVTIGYFFDISYKEKVADHVVTLVKKHQQSIDNFLKQRVANIRSLARIFSFDQLNNDAFLKERLLVLQEEYGSIFVDIGLVNQNGIQIAYAGPYSLKNADYSKSEWFKQSIDTDVYVSDVFHGLRGVPHFIIAVRREREDGTRWILRATVDFESFNSLVENIRIGKTGFAFILNRRGEFQTQPRFEISKTKAPYIEFMAGEKIRPDQIGFVEQSLGSGEDTLHVMAPLKGGNWLLAFQQNSSDAYKVLEYARLLTLGIFWLGGLGIIVVAILLSKRMVRHIARADLEKEMMNEQVIEAGKLASLGELAAGIAHEINNPVAIMAEEAGWIEDLLTEEDFKDSENLDEFRRALSQIRTQGKRCKEITHKLLSFARKTDPTVKNVQLNEMIEDVIALSEQRAKYANVKLFSELDNELPTVDVSPSEVQQVLLNLVNNAVDAMEPQGGKVTLSSKVENNFIVIDVADDGPGIPKANLSRIFDPFFTTKPVGKGTGLGLSICYGIIKKMGGEISVSSAVSLGTTFHIRIPVPEKAATESSG